MNKYLKINLQNKKKYDKIEKDFLKTKGRGE